MRNVGILTFDRYGYSKKSSAQQNRQRDNHNGQFRYSCSRFYYNVPVRKIVIKHPYKMQFYAQVKKSFGAHLSLFLSQTDKKLSQMVTLHVSLVTYSLFSFAKHIICKMQQWLGLQCPVTGLLKSMTVLEFPESWRPYTTYRRPALSRRSVPFGAYLPMRYVCILAM